MEIGMEPANLTEEKLAYKSFFDLINQPHIVRAREEIAEGKFKPRRHDISTCIRLTQQGFYNNVNEIDGCDASSWTAREVVCKVSSSVVGVSEIDLKLNSSGLIVAYAGKKIIATSTYILGNYTNYTNVLGRQVDVLLANRERITGGVWEVDEYHNLVLIEADIINEPFASFSDKLSELDTAVIAVGRDSYYNISTARGQIKIRDDNLDSDDLMSSTCTISECGIGGPLIDMAGNVLGMNFYNKKNSTPFMPSIILINCVKQLLDNRRVLRPYLGMKVRSLQELKFKELEPIYMKFQSSRGIIVKEVANGSPAFYAGICVGDVIISVNGTCLSSPVQLADLLLEEGSSHNKALDFDVENMINDGKLEVAVQNSSSGKCEYRTMAFQYFPRYSPINRWPILPYVDDCKTSIVTPF